MRTAADTRRGSPGTRLRGITLITVVTLLAMFAATTASHASVGLGTADSFAVLAGQSVTNTGPTTISGDVGIHPGAAVPPNTTGFGSVSLTGSVHDGDAVAEQAKVDLVTAYNDAAGRPLTATLDPQLDGQSLVGGVYDSSDGTFGIAVNGTLTLDGDASAVWVFKTNSTLIAESGSRVSLLGDADPCNVFWQVGSSATLGTSSDTVGTIMAMESITLVTGAQVQGRVLARNGSVTMDSNLITNAACATPTDADDDTTGSDDTTGGDDTTGDDDTTGGDGTTSGDDPTEGADTTGDDDGSGDDDTAGGDDTSGGDGTSGGDDKTWGDGTTSQLREVPRGGVAAGGGGSAPGGTPLMAAVLLMLVAMGGSVGVAARRRVRA